MRTITKEITLYTFGELSDAAKETARDWYRQDIEFDAECVLDSCNDAARLLGITIDRPRGRRTGYAVDWDTNPIGAAFVGSWSARECYPEKLRAEFPQDETLHAIADQLGKVAAAFEDAYASCGAGPYYAQTVDAELGEYCDDSDAAADTDSYVDNIVDALQSFAHWIGRSVAAEMDYQYSDEYVDESIAANEYEFTADGEVYS